MSELTAFESQLEHLIAEHKWQDIIDSAFSYSFEERCKYLWAWPSKQCLLELSEILRKLQIKSILSIGCGSGLLEWLIHKVTEICVFGLEYNENWWFSKYSPRTFIKINFTSTDITPDYLNRCAGNTANYALMFCYFNDRKAFNNYLKCYMGTDLIIIGPYEHQEVVTNPMPRNPGFDEFNINSWNAVRYLDVGDGINEIVFYKRFK